MIALYFYKAFAYFIYLVYCWINDFVTISLKFLHCFNLETEKEKCYYFFFLISEGFVLKQKINILIPSSLLYLLWPQV